MSQQSHAKKASQLFKELVSDTKAVFKGLAASPEVKHLAADFRHTGAEIKGILKAAGEGVEAAFKHAHSQAKALWHSAHDKVKEKLSDLHEKLHEDSSPEQHEGDEWTQLQDVIYGEAAPAVPLETCVLIGVQPAELAFEAHP